METNRKPTNLALAGLELHAFRSYDVLVLDDIGPLSLFVGPNAAGKTNIIEAIQLVTSLTSFRTTRSGEMVKWGSDNAFVKARMINASRLLDIRLDIRNNRRTYQLNGKPRNIQTLKGLLPAVVFCPDDLQLVKGTKSARRAALDMVGSQLSPNYAAVKGDYGKLLKQRNKALKDGQGDAYIDSIDEVLVRVGTKLTQFRHHAVDLIVPLIAQNHASISDDDAELSLSYTPMWAQSGGVDTRKGDVGIIQEAYYEALQQARAADRARGLTTVGSHADDVSFHLDGHDASSFASQGQQRTIVLAFKLAETQVIEQHTGQTPILLLDDVMSELDEQRRSYFMEFISGDIQTFITATTTDYFSRSLIERATLYSLPF